MNTSAYRLGWFALATIVALRVGIGMHFFGEGAKKLESDQPFSQYFLAAAKGPLAPHFHKMIWDREGRARLGYGLDEYGMPKIDLSRTTDAWDDFKTQIVDHYGVTAEEDQEALKNAMDRRIAELEWYMGDNEEDIVEYFNGLDRQAKNDSDRARQEVPSLYGQTQSIEAEMASNRRMWLGTVDKIWANYEKDLNELGANISPEAEYLEITLLDRQPLDSIAIDRIIPWFDVIIGSLLVVGLFTRLAAFSAGVFLLSVCLSQWPTALGANPVWGEAIEMLACFALVGLAAGRIAGLDSILHNIRIWCCPPKDPSYE